MCDTLCAIGARGSLFAKNSDRPPSEAQLIEAFGSRTGGGLLRTQYLEIEDAGSFSLLGSRPEWLWGLEHGVNEHRVAIGNEKIWTKDDPFKAPEALIGMDLVRLGLERGRTAEEALEAMIDLLERHGQGGIADAHAREPYFSSFLVAGPTSGWVVETSGRTWVASPVADSGAISNRLTLRTDWTRASSDVPGGADWDAWRRPDAPTGHADRRLAASRACLARGPGPVTAADLAAHLRDHGDGPWGAPGGDSATVSALPGSFDPLSGEGVTVCMHVRGYQNTTSSMIAELPEDAEAPLRAWVAPGSPCASVYVPVFPPEAVPAALAEPATWRRFAELRNHVERDGGALAALRAVFAPLEAELWAEAEEAAGDPATHASFVEHAWSRVEAALDAVSTIAAR